MSFDAEPPRSKSLASFATPSTPTVAIPLPKQLHLLRVGQHSARTVVKLGARNRIQFEQGPQLAARPDHAPPNGMQRGECVLRVDFGRGVFQDGLCEYHLALRCDDPTAANRR